MSLGTLGRIVVVGGSGYVGRRICEAALKKGLEVCSISRSGSAKLDRAAEDWTKDVKWLKADVFEPQQYRDHLKGALAVG